MAIALPCPLFADRDPLRAYAVASRIPQRVVCRNRSSPSFLREIVRELPASVGDSGAGRRIAAIFLARISLSATAASTRGSSVVRLEGREANRLFVRGLDCLTGTPLLDIKPERRLLGVSNGQDR